MSIYSTFKYGAQKYGVTTTTTNLWAIEIDWDDDGLFDGSNDGVNAIGLSISRGRDNFLRLSDRGAAVGFERLRPGSAVVVLDNQDDRYDPNNTSSPLYPNVEPGRAIRIRVRPKGETDLKYLFVGTVSDIQANEDASGRKTAIISAIDGLQDIGDDDASSVILEDNTIDELINECLDDIDWPANKRRIESSLVSLPYWWAENRALTEIYDLVDVDGGYFFVDVEGNATFYPINTETALGASLTGDELLKEFELSRPWEVIRNRILVTANPLSEGAEQDIWTLGDVPLLAPLESRVFWATYLSTDGVVGAVDVVTPVSGTDYAANTLADGTGDDLTGTLSISVQAFGKSARITVVNNGTSSAGNTESAYITLLKLRGKPLTQAAPVSAEVLIGDGKRLFSSNAEKRQSSSQALDYANLLSLYLPSPQPYPVIRLLGRPETQFDLDLFDRVDVEITPRNIDSVFAVGKITHDWISPNGQSVLTTLHLEPSTLTSDVLSPVVAEFSPATRGLFNEVPIISGLAEQSVAFWFYANTAAATQNDLITWSGAFTIGYRVFSGSNKVAFQRFYDGVTDGYKLTNATISAGGWVHIVIAGTEAQDYMNVCYVNGANDTFDATSTTGTGTAYQTTGAGFRLGRGDIGTTDWWLKDLKVYNRVITSTEAAALAAGTPVIDGLAFSAPFVPTTKTTDYIGFEFGDKPAFDSARGRSGHFSKSSPTSSFHGGICRAYDYTP